MLCRTVLVLVGISVGTYAFLSGQNTVASPPEASADASASALTPAGKTLVEDGAAASTALRPSEATAVITPRVLNVADAAPRVAYPPSSGFPPNLVQLTRQIKFLLKRAGCYRGTIDGIWSAAVRRSMKAFTDRVNATLPVEQPDVILLAMLQSHKDGGCDVPCPPGQGLAVDGRCLPNGLVAKIAEKPAPASSIRAAATSRSRGKELHAGQQGSGASAKTRRRHASPPVGVSSSGRFPSWAARAFGDW